VPLGCGAQVPGMAVETRQVGRHADQLAGHSVTSPVGQGQALVLPFFARCTWQRVLDGRCTAAAGGASHGALVW
jgi:hypothetical protein